MPRGGYQQPSQPAPVSAPGKLSRRTDGGPAQTTQKMTGLAYGENADFNEMQSAAPLRATPGAAMQNPNASSRAGGGSSAPRGMFTPTERPAEPVTAGAPFGPGAGPMRAPKRMAPRISDTLAMLADASGDRGLASAAEQMRLKGR